MTRNEALAEAQAALAAARKLAESKELLTDGELAEKTKAIIDVADGWMRLAETITATDPRTIRERAR